MTSESLSPITQPLTRMKLIQLLLTGVSPDTYHLHFASSCPTVFDRRPHEGRGDPLQKGGAPERKLPLSNNLSQLLLSLNRSLRSSLSLPLYHLRTTAAYWQVLQPLTL